MTTFKKYIPVFLLLLFVGVGTMQAQGKTKVGYTNVELLLALMPQTAQVEKQLEIYSKKLEESLMAQQTAYQKKLEEYSTKKQANQISPAQEEAYIKELTKMEQELSAGLQEADYKLMVKRQELLQPLVEKIQNAVDAVAKEEGYTFILNQTMGGGITNILYGLEQDDVTPLLAKKLGIPLPEETPTGLDVDLDGDGN